MSSLMSLAVVDDGGEYHVRLESCGFQWDFTETFDDLNQANSTAEQIFLRYKRDGLPVTLELLTN
jgi:hypothetical protein